MFVRHLFSRGKSDFKIAIIEVKSTLQRAVLYDICYVYEETLNIQISPEQYEVQQFCKDLCKNARKACEF
jgi:hypothetical protein